MTSSACDMEAKRLGPCRPWLCRTSGKFDAASRRDADATEENHRNFHLEREGIDVAFLPFWYLLTADGQRVVRTYIRPKHIIAVHIPNPSASELQKASRTSR